MADEILLVAGEASADIQGAALLEELRKTLPDLRAFGVGGPRLAEQGMEILVSAAKLNAVGLAEIFGQLGELLGALRCIRNAAKTRRPRAAILMDLPDFNLSLSRHLHKLGIPVIYYISPQVWAWRRYRIRTIRRTVDRMLVLFPFEKAFYEEHGVRAEFVGHPLVEQLQARRYWRSQEEIQVAPRIAILPGSRKSELRHHGFLVRAVAYKLKQRYPHAELRVPQASTVQEGELQAALGGAPVEFVADSRAALEWADVALIASGTATLEAAVIGTPFSLFYRLRPSTAWILRHLVRYRKFFGMPNLLQGRSVVREFLHDDATEQNLVEETCRLLDDSSYRETVARDLVHCRELLGEPGGSRRAAREVNEVLRRGNKKEAAFVPAPA